MRTLFTLLLLFLLQAGPVFSASLLPELEKTGDAAGIATATSASDTGISVIVGRIISAALGFLGTLFLVYLVYGGFKWLTAAGNEEGVEEAKNIIRHATIGLALCLAAYGIASFVFQRITAATL